MQANWIVDRLDVLCMMAQTVKVIPIHRDRFLPRQVDIGTIKTIYERCEDVSTLQRVHDFNTGHV